MAENLFRFDIKKRLKVLLDRGKNCVIMNDAIYMKSGYDSFCEFCNTATGTWMKVSNFKVLQDIRRAKWIY